jgi:hypothetical protein
MFLRNAGKLLQDYTVSHPRRFNWFMLVAWLTFQPWRLYFPPKRRWTSTSIHSVTSQKVLTDSCWLLGLLFDLWGCTFLRKVGFTFRNIVSALHRRHVPGSDNVYEDVNDKSLNPSCWFVPRTKLHRTGTPLNDICFPISYADLKQFMYIFIICTTNIQLLALSCVPQPVLSSIYRHYRFI